jgi:hypothetical protein
MTREPEQLPELTLALRTLGSRRGRRGAGPEHERFFAPLLEARRAAARAGDVETAVRSFDAARLTSTFDKTIRSIAVDRAPSNRAPARRALEARLLERAEPLRDALTELGHLAEELLQADDASQDVAWERWAVQLRVVFECADRCWPGIDAALSATSPPRRGSFARLFRRRRS